MVAKSVCVVSWLAGPRSVDFGAGALTRGVVWRRRGWGCRELERGIFLLRDAVRVDDDLLYSKERFRIGCVRRESAR